MNQRDLDRIVKKLDEERKRLEEARKSLEFARRASVRWSEAMQRFIERSKEEPSPE